MNEKLPLWKLNMYADFDSPEYKNDAQVMADRTKALGNLVKSNNLWTDSPLKALEESLSMISEAFEYYENLESYTYCRYSTNTADAKAMAELNRLEEAALPLKQAMVLFNNRLAESGTNKMDWQKSPILAEYLFFLTESLKDQKYQMAPELEDLAADLSRPGGSAWSRLQETLSSTLKTEWEPGEWKTVTQLRLMGSDSDRNIRKRAWEKELKCWESAETALAAALNGVKGFAHTINSRRGYDSTLQRSISQARMAPETLNAMIEAMKESLPDFRRYLKTKASKMGLETLSWYDIIAPMGGGSKKWSWKESREFIVDNFASLSPEYASFGKKAFDEGWIDAQPREGKVGGAYCIGFPRQKESRILTNFDGAFTDVSTIAHELGHGWHGEVLKDAPALHRDYPMTLAETASIFSEILVFQAYYAKADRAEKESLLESSLSDSNQVIVDILSRFLFEQELMKRRAQGELTAEELKEIMLKAQDDTYGDALNKEERHPWMWAVKGHYYGQDLGFYNFPYAFGLLFGWGLYSLYEEMGADFEPLYRKVLLMTGKATAEECAAAAGIDISSKAFWQRSLSMITRQIDDFCRED
jgi:oligoendopeptidase F